MDCSPPGSSVHGYSPGQNTRVGSHALLQGIFPTQGSNLGLLHYRQITYHLSHQVSSKMTKVGLDDLCCYFSKYSANIPGVPTGAEHCSRLLGCISKQTAVLLELMRLWGENAVCIHQ